MKKLLLSSLLSFSLMISAQKKYVLVIHGGAGTILKSNMTAKQEDEYKAKLTEALKAGYAEIQKGNSSVDAVAASIMIMEDSPLFNAGKGAVFTAEGTNELDASIMYGKDKSAGAIAGVHTIKNPITAAIAVMQKSQHVMLSGVGAGEFAKEQKLEIVDPSYFWTKNRWEGLQKLKQKEKTTTKKVSQNTLSESYEIDQKFGTVGAVALDKSGNIAAGTSTGGMTNKKY
ncbi:isoaspartyl peptidase/L-asparaginase family protein, partial [Kaistella carnis]